jgi:hypothetical protein
MVYVGIHVKRIAGDLREMLERQAEIYPVTGVAVWIWRKPSPRRSPLSGPSESRDARARADDVCSVRPSKLNVFNISLSTFVAGKTQQRLSSRRPPGARKQARYSG